MRAFGIRDLKQPGEKAEMPPKFPSRTCHWKQLLETLDTPASNGCAELLVERLGDTPMGHDEPRSAEFLNSGSSGPSNLNLVS